MYVTNMMQRRHKELIYQTENKYHSTVSSVKLEFYISANKTIPIHETCCELRNCAGQICSCPLFMCFDKTVQNPFGKSLPFTIAMVQVSESIPIYLWYIKCNILSCILLNTVTRLLINEISNYLVRKQIFHRRRYMWPLELLYFVFDYVL